MSSPSSVAVTLHPEVRQKLGIEALSKSKPITRLAQDYQVSRKFVRIQSDKAKAALSKSFEPTPPEEQVLFHLAVTKSWLFQLIPGLVLICHSSLRGVVELLRDIFHLTISPSTVRNRLEAAAQSARAINAAEGLSLIEVDLRDEIFQGSSPVLVGIDAASTYCYLLALAEHRDSDTWGCHVLDAVAKGLAPARTIADFGTGLRAGHPAVFGDEVPCHGDVFHLQHQCQGVVNSLNRQAMGATTQRQTLEQEMEKAKLKGQGHRLSTKLTQARQAESIALGLARDVKTLIQCFYDGL